MAYRYSYGLTTVALVALLFFVPAQAAQQEGTTTDVAYAAGTAKTDSNLTPRMPNGHPDLSGTWYVYSGRIIPQENRQLGEIRDDGSRIATYAQRGPGNRSRQAERSEEDAQLQEQLRPRHTVPQYKPEFVAKVEDLEARQLYTDPTFICRPPGLPRVGAPHKIVHGVGEIAIVYSDITGNFWRIVPTDGRSRNTDFDPSYFGDSVGRWEGDTLVIETSNFNDDTWLDDGGTFHSEALHVVERLRREGDTLYYDVTAEDPEVLLEPYAATTRVLQRSDEPLETAPYCKDYDQGNAVNLDHHGAGR